MCKKSMFLKNWHDKETKTQTCKSYLHPAAWRLCRVCVSESVKYSSTLWATERETEREKGQLMFCHMLIAAACSDDQDVIFWRVNCGGKNI